MLRKIYISDYFYYAMISLVLFWIGVYLWPVFYWVVMPLSVLIAIWAAYDIFRLFTSGTIDGERICADRFSNGDNNIVKIRIRNAYRRDIELLLIDELPFQFQMRDTEWNIEMEGNTTEEYYYELRPVKRGEYEFGKLRVYVRLPFGLFQRQFTSGEQQKVAVFPSFQKLKEYEFMAFHRRSGLPGQKRRKKIGVSLEFEQIKSYVRGDDVRFLNWKASARRGELMLNQYRDEKSQQLICLLDKGRTMEMSFKGMSLLDYSINASLALSDIALKKGDLAGLMTFSHKLSAYVKPAKGNRQFARIQKSLYHQKTNFKESDYKLAAGWLRGNLHQRSLILLFTNFESELSVERHLEYLKSLSRRHLLLVVLFKNHPLEQMAERSANNKREVYSQIIAEQLVREKLLITKQLRRHGILSLLTHPEDLSVQLINRYLQIKEAQRL